MTTEVVEVSRKTILSIMDKLSLEYPAKIPQSRAQVKLERAIKKNGDLLKGVKLKPSQRAALTAMGLLGSVATEEESPAVEETPKAKKTKKPKVDPPAPTGNVQLMQKLLAKGKSEKKIKKVFLKRFKKAGFTDEADIMKRVAIYRSLAEGDQKKESSTVAKKDKDEKPAKKKKAKAAAEETPSEKPKKKKAKVAEEPAPAKKKAKKKGGDEEE